MKENTARQLTQHFERIVKDSGHIRSMDREEVIRIPYIIIMSSGVDLESFLTTFKILKDTRYDNNPILVLVVAHAWVTAFPYQKGLIIQAIYEISRLYERNPMLFAVIIEGLIIALLEMANSDNLITTKTALSLILHRDFVKTMQCAPQTPAGMSALSTALRNLVIFPRQKVAGGDLEGVLLRKRVVVSFLEKLAYGTDAELTYTYIEPTPDMLIKGVLHKPDNSLATVLVNELISKLILDLTPEKKVEAFFALKLKI